MKTTAIVMLALLLTLSTVALAGGGQCQNQLGKEDGEPGNGSQVKERERPDDPQGDGCPDDCPACPNGDGDGICDQAAAMGADSVVLATQTRSQARAQDGDCEDPAGDGPNGPNGDGEGDGPNGPNGDGEGDGPNGPNGPNGDGDGEGPFGPGECTE